MVQLQIFHTRNHHCLFYFPGTLLLLDSSYYSPFNSFLFLNSSSLWRTAAVVWYWCDITKKCNSYSCRLECSYCSFSSSTRTTYFYFYMFHAMLLNYFSCNTVCCLLSCKWCAFFCTFKSTGSST